MPRFPPHRIKFLLKEVGHTPTTVADKYNYTKPQVSMCINGQRVYPALRIIISNLIHRDVEAVFGKHELTTALLEEREAEQQNAA
jgi:hypothetical protein